MKKGSMVLRLFLYASLVSLVWLGTYVGLSGLFSVKEAAPEQPPAPVTPAGNLPATVSTGWSVLVVTDEEREVTEFMFRYADFLKDTLVFVRVPVETKAELVSGGYEVLSVHNPELPELFMISDLCRIFSEETWCMAAEEVGVALLGVRPKHCYVIENTLYEKLTETVNGETRFQTPESVKDVILEVTGHAVTDGTAEEELLYWESYLDVEEVYYRTLPGTATAEEYRPDWDGIQRMTEGFQTGFFEEMSEGQ